MDIREYTKEDFDNVSWKPERMDVRFNSFVIVPENELHDSGFGCMSFVLLDDQMKIIGKIGGSTDVIHFDGIGGYGYNWHNSPHMKDIFTWSKGWSIDMLPCGYLRVFAKNSMFIDAPYILSDFQVYAEERKDV